MESELLTQFFYVDNIVFLLTDDSLWSLLLDNLHLVMCLYVLTLLAVLDVPC